MATDLRLAPVGVVPRRTVGYWGMVLSVAALGSAFAGQVSAIVVLPASLWLLAAVAFHRVRAWPWLYWAALLAAAVTAALLARVPLALPAVVAALLIVDRGCACWAATVVACTLGALVPPVALLFAAPFLLARRSAPWAALALLQGGAAVVYTTMAYRSRIGPVDTAEFFALTGLTIAGHRVGPR